MKLFSLLFIFFTPLVTAKNEKIKDNIIPIDLSQFDNRAGKFNGM